MVGAWAAWSIPTGTTGRSASRSDRGRMPRAPQPDILSPRKTTRTTRMSTTSRRTFMAASAAFSLGRVLGANEKVNVGIIGIGGRGNDHIKSYATLPDARIVALCDVN